ncbi:MAG: hypothetical protein P1V34_08880 [Alphaproteobacteria bacterium]|nr:hypothetical protein [Alphaproteobacteria bacterium]
MSDTLLPASLDAALQRLEKALEFRPDAPVGTPQDSAEIDALREELVEAQAEIEQLKGALNQANARRAAALKKVDHAVGQVDDLLAGIEPKAG